MRSRAPWRLRRRIAGGRCTQGVEAQSVANCYTATETRLEVVPVINKIDLPSAEPARVIKEIEAVIGISADDALRVSGKTGQGVEDLIEQLIERIPAPKGDPAAPLQALIVDPGSTNYVGVVTLVRIFNGTIKVNDKMRVMSTAAPSTSTSSALHAQVRGGARLGSGDVGFIIGGIRKSTRAVGDTITLERHQATSALPGFKQVKPRVFAACFRLPPTTTKNSATRCRSWPSTTRHCIRTRSVHRSGLRLSRGFPRPVAHGDRAGAAGARIRDGLITSAPTWCTK